MARVYRTSDGLAWLDSGNDAANAGRWSLMAADPVAELVQHWGAPATLRVGGEERLADASAWRLWRTAVDRLPTWPTAPIGLAPGWIGWVGFEAAGQLERLPAPRPAELALPIVRLGLYDRALVLDRRARRAWRLTALGLRRILRLPDAPGNDCGAAPAPPRGAAGGGWRISEDPPASAYERAVERALAYIAAGDVYQVNLARRIRFAGGDDPLATYLRLRAANPAPYAAFVACGAGAAASVSPELFLRLRGRAVRTSPIKGTRPHHDDAAADDRARAELLGSAKEQAELRMIIDLHRNDLGRVCATGSVRVAAARRLETHPTVHHTVADVEGELAPGRNGVDLLAAAFPAGSISGVPKIRALELIHALEPQSRGVYTGALGVLGLDGDMTWNVAIRTLQMAGGAATLHVGGGIVADSDPAAEYAETCAKARGILRGLGAAPDVCGATGA